MTIREVTKIHAENRREVQRLKKQHAREAKAGREEMKRALADLKRGKGEFLAVAVARWRATVAARRALVQRHGEERTALAQRIANARRELAERKTAWPGVKSSWIQSARAQAERERETLRAATAREVAELEIAAAEGDAEIILRGAGVAARPEVAKAKLRTLSKKKAKPSKPRAKTDPMRTKRLSTKANAAGRVVDALRRYIRESPGGVADQHQLRAVVPSASPLEVGAALSQLLAKHQITVTRRPFGPAEARMVKAGTHPAPIIGKQAITGARWVAGQSALADVAGGRKIVRAAAAKKKAKAIVQIRTKKATTKKATTKKATTKKATTKKATTKKATTKKTTTKREPVKRSAAMSGPFLVGPQRVFPGSALVEVLRSPGLVMAAIGEMLGERILRPESLRGDELLAAFLTFPGETPAQLRAAIVGNEESSLWGEAYALGAQLQRLERDGFVQLLEEKPTFDKLYPFPLISRSGFSASEDPRKPSRFIERITILRPPTLAWKKGLASLWSSKLAGKRVK